MPLPSSSLSLSRTVTDAGDTRYTLRNAHDMRVTISDRGATLISWWAPDRYGRVADVLLGHPDAASYAAGNPEYFGATVGRWANRIGAGRFTLDGAEYLLDRNNGANHLHGGDTGFHQALWTAHLDDDASLRFTLESPDGDGGYPGNLQAEVVYRLGDDGALRIDYRATCDAPTPVNLTSHGYFNLNGGSGDIGDHQLFIDADNYLPVDAGLIPVGVAAVAGSAFDFRQPAPIGPRLGWPEPQLALGGGFDHCYSLRGAANGADKVLRDVAQVYDPGSGRRLSVATTEAGLQFYSGNFLAGVPGRDGKPYAKHDGFCLEAEAWPNQINGPDAEAVVLRPGQVYRQTTIYKLDLKD